MEQEKGENRAYIERVSRIWIFKTGGAECAAGKEGMEMLERMKRRMQRLFTRKRPVLSSAILTLCFLLTVVLLTSGCSTDQEQGSSSGGKDSEVTAADMRGWFGTSIAKIMSDEQVESLAQQLLTVIGDSQTADGVTVTLDAAMRDEESILLSFTVEGDSRLTPSAGRLGTGKVGHVPLFDERRTEKNSAGRQRPGNPAIPGQHEKAAGERR